MLFLLALAGLAGYLLSKASLVGKIGISVFYQQYRFLKTWWQGGLVLFAVWMLLFFLQQKAQQRCQPRTARLVHFGAILVAGIGLYFTYLDFRNSLSHRWLGERFHLGGYLFWFGWISISLFFLTAATKVTKTTITAANESVSVPGEPV